MIIIAIYAIYQKYSVDIIPQKDVEKSSRYIVTFMVTEKLKKNG